MVTGQSLRRVLSIPGKLEPEGELMEEKQSEESRVGIRLCRSSTRGLLTVDEALSLLL